MRAAVVLWTLVLFALPAAAQDLTGCPNDATRSCVKSRSILLENGENLEESVQGGRLATPDLCRTGLLPGAPEGADGLRPWTCVEWVGWGANYGGIDGNGVSDYDTATQAGGNAWNLNCSGEGAGTATALDGTSLGSPLAEDQGVCLRSGESILMYAATPVMLAADQTRSGGTVYLPERPFQDRGCGRQPDGDPNPCPVLQHSPTHPTRMIASTRGVKFVGSGLDPGGPFDTNGRAGSWYIDDHGNQGVFCGAADDEPCDADPNGDAFGGGSALFRHHSLRIGRFRQMLGGLATSACAWPSGATGCVTTDTVVATGINSPPVTPVGRGSYLLDGVAEFDGVTTSCIENDLATTGMCSGSSGNAAPYTVRCTDDTETRTGNHSGGCPGALGTCVGFVDMLAGFDDSDDRDHAHVVGSLMHPALSDDDQELWNEGFYGFHAWVDGDDAGAACQTTGESVIWAGNTQSSEAIFWPFPVNAVEGNEDQLVNQLWVTDSETWEQDEGGFYGLNTMPASWGGRNSSNDAADCLQNSNTETDSNQACDEFEVIGAGSGRGGAAEDMSFWYTGGPDSYSTVDGEITGFGQRLERFRFRRGTGAITDASGWIIRDWDVDDWHNVSGGLFALNFSTRGLTENIRISNVRAGRLFQFQGAAGGFVRDISISATTVDLAAFYFLGRCKGSYLDQINVQGLRGTLIYVELTDGNDIADCTVRNVYGNLLPYPAGLNPRTVFHYGDFNGARGTTDGKLEGLFRFENARLTYAGDNPACLIFMEGQTGDESDADNGQGRRVHLFRNHFWFEDLHFQRTTGADNGQVFCFGNWESGSLKPDDAGVLELEDTVGPLFGWRSIYKDGVRLVDNPYPTQAASEVQPGSELEYGQIVRIHDDTGVGDCADSADDGQLDGGGTSRSLCQWVSDNGDSDEGWQAY